MPPPVPDRGPLSLRSRLAQPEIVVAPGIFDGLTASLAVGAGFEALYLSGASIAYTRFGRPDIGLVSFAEVAETLSVVRERVAAPIIVETGEPVMALGGFHGLDQILPPADLARLVDARQVRFVMLGDLSPISERMGGGAALAPWPNGSAPTARPSILRCGGPMPAAAAGPRSGSSTT